MFTVLREGLRMAHRARQKRQKGFDRYTGNPQDVCEQILDRTYDAERGYFRVSAGHFCQFYTRDFAYCCEALCDLGYRKEVAATLSYALACFERADRITTAISPQGRAFDYFMPSGPESPALLLYALTHTGNEDIARKHKAFLQRQVDYFVEHTIDRKTLLARGDRTFSSIRDQAQRKASCYDAVMVAVLAREAKALGLRIPYEEEDARDALMRNYWNGTYFFQDLRKQPIVVGDANVFPFWTGIVADKAVLDQAFTAMRATGLDTPFPLRYVSQLDKRREWTRFPLAGKMFAKDYETDSIWMHLGLAYLRVLSQHDPQLVKRHLEKYTQLIRRHGTFLELYDTHGEPYRRAFYVADEGMVWCANYLALAKEMK